MKRVNVGLKENVHTRAKIVAALKKMTLNKYFEKAIEEAIQKDKYILKELAK